MTFVAQALAAMALLGFFVWAWGRFSHLRQPHISREVRVAPHLPEATGDISLGGGRAARRAPRV